MIWLQMIEIDRLFHVCIETQIGKALLKFVVQKPFTKGRNFQKFTIFPQETICTSLFHKHETCL